MLDDMGLIPTLQWHFARYTSQTGIRVKFQHDKFAGRMSSEIETAAFRIIQEALTNVARYAGVKEVFVGIALYEDSIWLEILDKGRGFNAASVMERPTTGLGGMRERASMAGGFLVVESYIDQGTQIVAALPLSDRPIERRKNARKNPAG
jgi:signal transduction histidine kinase